MGCFLVRERVTIHNFARHRRIPRDLAENGARAAVPGVFRAPTLCFACCQSACVRDSEHEERSAFYGGPTFSGGAVPYVAYESGVWLQEFDPVFRSSRAALRAKRISVSMRARALGRNTEVDRDSLVGVE